VKRSATCPGGEVVDEALGHEGGFGDFVLGDFTLGDELDGGANGLNAECFLCLIDK
jgi:hypothetical protein